MVHGNNVIYIRIDWENYPSDKTPLNERNLNMMDLAIHLLDERVVWLNENKFDKTESFKLVKNIDLDEETGIFTITYYDNTTKKIDTILEKIATNWDFDEINQQLIITLDDGTVKMVDLSALITQYEFMTSDTVSFEAQPDGKVKAIVREGSIQEKHLQPDYLADIRIEQGKAQQSAEKSEEFAKLSESYAHGGTGARPGEDEDNAREYARQAKESADRASDVVSDVLPENIFKRYTFEVSVMLSTMWREVYTLKEIEEGSYLVQIIMDYPGYTNIFDIKMYFTGILSLGFGNKYESDEVLLNRSGQDDGERVFLKTCNGQTKEEVTIMIAFNNDVPDPRVMARLRFILLKII